MNWLRGRAPGTEGAADPLAAHRGRVMYAASLVGVVFILPFAVHDLLKGRLALGLAALGVALALGTDAIAIHRKKTPPIPVALLLIPMAAAVTISLQTLGVIGA